MPELLVKYNKIKKQCHIANIPICRNLNINVAQQMIQCKNYGILLDTWERLRI